MAVETEERTEQTIQQEGLAWRKVPEVSCSVKQSSLAWIWDMCKEVVRIILDKYIHVIRAEWQVEESVLNFVG